MEADGHSPIPFSDPRWAKERSSVGSVGELEERHRHFRQIDFAGMSMVDIERIFFEHYGIFSFVQVQGLAAELNRAGLFRARWINPTQEDVSSFQTHSYPQAEYCRSLGRANLIGHPVLYLSERPSSAMFEVGYQKASGQELFLTRWHWKDGPVRVFPVLPGADSGGRSTEVHHQWMQGFQLSVKRQKLEGGDVLLKLFECWSELFLEESKYPVTSWMAHTVLHSSKVPVPFDLLAYPSIARRRQSACYAVAPRLVDDGTLTLASAVRLKVSSHVIDTISGGFTMEISDVEVATAENRILKWVRMEEDSFLQQEFPDLGRMLRVSDYGAASSG